MKRLPQWGATALLLCILGGCGDEKTTPLSTEAAQKGAAEETIPPSTNKTDPGPSVEETIRFLHNLAFVWNGYDEKLSFPGKDPCVATFSGRDEISYSDHALAALTIAFGQLNPESLEVRADAINRVHKAEIGVRTTNAEKVIRIRSDEGDNSVYTLTVYVRDNKDLAKVRKALEHAIRRCGGKKDLF